MTYRERLWPSTWVWIACLLIASTGGLVVIKVASVTVALVVAVACMLAAAYGLARTSSTVSVTSADGGSELVAGRAHIPVRLLGPVQVLRGDEVTDIRGPGADARAYLCQRGWISTGVRVAVNDTDDSTPYWFISSRRPGMLAEAIATAIHSGTGDLDEPGEASATPSSGDTGPTVQAHSKHTG